MNVNRYLVPAFLALAAWLAVGDSALAQRGGKGGGAGPPGGGRPGGGMGNPGGGNYNRGGGNYNQGGGFYNYGGPRTSFYFGAYPSFGYNSLSYGYSGLGYGFGGPNYGYAGNSLIAPYYGSSSFNYVSPIVPQYSYYASPIVPQQAAVPAAPVAPAIPAGAAQVRVILPDPAAKVWFDGTITQQTGNDRYFHTPALEAGSTYTYRIRASWMQEGKEELQERVVNITSGATAVADFR